MSRSPIYVALDTPDHDAALAMARKVARHAGGLKLGLEYFCANGPDGVVAIAKAAGLPIFLDLKLHDIPNTVASGLRSLMRLDPKPAIVNVHATGGPDMMKAAADAVAGQSRPIPVPIPPSFSDHDIRAAGFENAKKP